MRTGRHDNVSLYKETAMNRNSLSRRLAQVAMVAAASALPMMNATYADEDALPEWGYGYGYGMGPGMMRGYGPGYGYGPGMMGDGWGMGPGMMWRDGGGGPGMMRGYDGVGATKLTDDQRAQLNKLPDGERPPPWALMGKMLDGQTVLRDLYAQNEPDPKKVGAAYGEIAKLRQQMVELRVQTQNQIQKLLTPEQREQLQEWRRGGWGPRGHGPEGGPGSRAPGMMGR